LLAAPTLLGKDRELGEQLVGIAADIEARAADLMRGCA
jgi:hypothetical protein